MSQTSKTELERALRQTRDDAGICRRCGKPGAPAGIDLCFPCFEVEEPAELTAGGQGRTAAEVEAAGWVGVVWWLACLGLGIASLRWLFS